ncbi:hypothetical protein OOZ15_19560 [Galbibacter sp. EGI 63066]|uniref:hypothetical protein n=1 Tax=Galbibacter sp. EGI 63066 TaxID=2993559 RepID=UPI0022499964|nr:hypothetical protein [Galbibacter sp. EGI 63066]MCX2682153.1 hypothetical protein [Galbibacter sp. EGI 63066]
MSKEAKMSLLSLMLPEGILDHFDIAGFEGKPIKLPLYVNRLILYLEEKANTTTVQGLSV